MSATPDRGQGGLLERGAELAAIAACAEAVAAGEGRAVVVQGPPGIGKTELVAAARAMACEAGLRPLAARGTEIERAFGFGVVRQLLEPAVRDDPDATDFDGPARYAADLLGRSLAEPAAVPLGPEGAFVVQHGLYHVAANLARRPAAGPARRRRALGRYRVAAVPGLCRQPAGSSADPARASPRGRPANPEAPPSPRCWRVPRARSSCVRRRSATCPRRRSCARPFPDAEAALCQACHMHDRRKPVLPARARACAARGRPRSRGRRARRARPRAWSPPCGPASPAFPPPARQFAGAAAVVGDGALIRHAAALAGPRRRDGTARPPTRSAKAGS